MYKKPATLIISLDFELYWGVRDKRTLKNYRKRLLGVRQVVPRMLSLFKQNNIHATWATVGFLFHKTKSDLLKNLPDYLPQYSEKNLSPYQEIKNIGKNEDEDPFHFAGSLVEKIQNSPFQEIGTHTYSHYYCLESGQNKKSFTSDLETAIRVAKARGIILSSIVFPRNQVNNSYLKICKNLGIVAYRGNKQNWMHKGVPDKKNFLIRRGGRLIDSYFPTTRDKQTFIEKEGIINFPASRFFRSIKQQSMWHHHFQLRRILAGMRETAISGGIYHIWWHPHNFGLNIQYLYQKLINFNS